MLSAFQKYISDQQLIKGKKPVLLAVSGGVDSVVMVRLFEQSGIPFGIAHCNYQLRGKESVQDGAFVKTLAKKLAVPCHEIAFDTLQFANDNGMGIQEAARHLRYNWFSELRKQNGYAAVATAHHADDVAETILLHLVRGSGIAGFHGIVPKTGHLIRPLLFATRREIESFAIANKLKWRTDSSNAKTIYSRNKIRHKVMPVLRSINPNVVQAFAKNAVIMQEYEELINDVLQSFKKSRVKHNGKITTIDLSGFGKVSGAASLLFLTLQEYGFGSSEVHDLMGVIRSQTPGKKFYSSTHICYTDRKKLEIVPLSSLQVLPIISIAADAPMTDTPVGTLQQSRIKLTPSVRKIMQSEFKSPHICWLDAATLQYPLQLRSKQPGDRFVPFGMKGSKLVSDYMTDNKFSAVQKERLYLLWSGAAIAWLAGYRIADPFKVTAATKEAVRLEILPKI